MVELNLGKIKQTDAELEEKIQEIAGSGGSSGGFDVLWEGSMNIASFSPQEVELINSILDYKFYEVFFATSPSSPWNCCVGSKFLSPRDGLLVRAKYGSDGGIYSRSVIVNYNNNPKSVRFERCLKFSGFTSSNGSENNSYCLPVMIVGYK